MKTAADIRKIMQNSNDRAYIESGKKQLTWLMQEIEKCAAVGYAQLPVDNLFVNAYAKEQLEKAGFKFNIRVPQPFTGVDSIQTIITWIE